MYPPDESFNPLGRSTIRLAAVQVDLLRTRDCMGTWSIYRLSVVMATRPAIRQHRSKKV